MALFQPLSTFLSQHSCEGHRCKRDQRVNDRGDLSHVSKGLRHLKMLLITASYGQTVPPTDQGLFVWYEPQRSEKKIQTLALALIWLDLVPLVGKFPSSSEICWFGSVRKASQNMQFTIPWGDKHFYLTFKSFKALITDVMMVSAPQSQKTPALHPPHWRSWGDASHWGRCVYGIKTFLHSKPVSKHVNRVTADKWRVDGVWVSCLPCPVCLSQCDRPQSSDTLEETSANRQASDESAVCFSPPFLSISNIPAQLCQAQSLVVMGKGGIMGEDQRAKRGAKDTEAD